MPVFGAPPARISNLVVDDDLDMGNYNINASRVKCSLSLWTNVITQFSGVDTDLQGNLRAQYIRPRANIPYVSITDLKANGKRAYLDEGLTVDRHTLTAGPTLLYTDSAEVRPTADAWLKLKEVVIPPEYIAVGVRVEWEGRQSSIHGGSCQYQVRVNDEPIGEIKSVSGDTYTPFSNDILFPDATELKLQIWGYDTEGSYEVYLRNMEVLGTDTIDTQYIGGLSEWPTPTP